MAEDEDVLDLPEPLHVPEHLVAELPLPEPPAREPVATAQSEEEPARKPTLFERMMNLSKKPRLEPEPVETLAPEPEAKDDGVAIPPMPPFFRAQRN
jgi:hypothetical protein